MSVKKLNHLLNVRYHYSITFRQEKSCSCTKGRYYFAGVVAAFKNTDANLKKPCFILVSVCVTLMDGNHLLRPLSYAAQVMNDISK